MPAFWGALFFRALSQIDHVTPLPIPLRDGHLQLGTRQSKAPGTNDNAATARTSYAGISLLCMLIMAGCFGARFHQIFARNYWKDMTFIRLIPFLLYFFGIGFDILAAITVAGMGLHQESIVACKGAMYVCLVFYCGTKVCVQLFLIERAHVVRRVTGRKRLDDALWLLFMLIVVVGFGTIVILAFMAPVGMVDEGDGQCRIGLPRTSVMVLMTYDILINLALTGVFLTLLRPLFQLRTHRPLPTIGLVASVSKWSLRPLLGRGEHSTSTVSGSSAKAPIEMASMVSPSQPVTSTSVVDPNTDHLRSLVGKSMFGAIVMLVATLINLTLLYKYDGQEHGWICFLCRLIDVTWTVMTIHLLTEGKKQDNRPALILHHQRSLPERRGTLVPLAFGRRAHSEDSSGSRVR